MELKTLEKEFKEVAESGEKIVKSFSKKFLLAAGILKDDLIYGARLGSLKLKEQSLYRAKARVLYAVGKIIYKKYLKGEIKDENLVKLLEHYRKLEEISRKYYGYENKLKKKIASPI